MEEFYLKNVFELLDSDDEVNIQLVLEMLNRNEELFSGFVRWLMEDSFDVDGLLEYYFRIHLKFSSIVPTDGGGIILYFKREGDDYEYEYVIFKGMQKWFFGRFPIDNIGFVTEHQKHCKYAIRCFY
jgi:hypothetical protein